MGMQRLKRELYSLFYLIKLEVVPTEQADDFKNWFRVVVFCCFGVFLGFGFF